MPRNYNNYYGNYYNGRQQQQRRNWRGRYEDGDLEWDNYDLGSGGQRNVKDKRYHNRNNPNHFHRYSNFPSSTDSELEWDDYDLRQKQEECLEGLESILPLLNELNKAPRFHGNFNSRGRYNRSYGRYHDDIRMRRFKINQDYFVLNGYSSLSHNWENNRGNKHYNNNRRNGYDRHNGYDRYGYKRDGGRPDQKFYSARDRIGRPSNLPIDDWLMSNTFSLMQNKRRLKDVNLYTLSPQDLEPYDSSQNGSVADLSDLGLYDDLGLDLSVGRSADGDDDTVSLTSVASLADDNGLGKKAKAKKAKKRKRKGGEKGCEATENDDGNKNKKVAPNFFVAVQVSNPKIQRSLRQVQNHVLNFDEKLKDAMIPLPTMHLTIMVMHLGNEEEIEKAKKALEASHKELSVKFGEEKLLIHFQGLSHFNNQVMFARILDDDSTIEVLYNIAETVERCFKEHGISSTGERGFKPHLTVMKLSRAPSLRKKGVRRIKSEVYKEHSNKYFGAQVMRGLQLCSITKPKTGDGYYAKLQEFYFGTYGELEEEDDGVDLIGDPVIESASNNQDLNPLNELIQDLKEQKKNTISTVTESVKKALKTSVKEEDSTSELVSESSLDRTADLTTSCDDIPSEDLIPQEPKEINTSPTEGPDKM
ncbi:uncharacterized protein [Antedon mediterranea]|uniref:uncharacterized protein isoform X3 n=1 Tax=Antedon mediterranea TaxID=105859 RepID=UPI003AF4E955